MSHLAADHQLHFPITNLETDLMKKSCDKIPDDDIEPKSETNSVQPLELTNDRLTRRLIERLGELIGRRLATSNRSILEGRDKCAPSGLELAAQDSTAFRKVVNNA